MYLCVTLKEKKKKHQTFTFLLKKHLLAVSFWYDAEVSKKENDQIELQNF